VRSFLSAQLLLCKAGAHRAQGNECRLLTASQVVLTARTLARGQNEATEMHGRVFPCFLL